MADGQKERTINMNLKILNWNVEGLRNVMNLTPWEMFSQFDVCALTETFVTEATQLQIQDFYCIQAFARKEERGRPKGGLACLLKPHMTPYEVKAQDDNKLIVQTRECLIIVVYYQPEFTAKEIIDNLSQALEMAAEGERIILCGDLNCPIDKRTEKAMQVVAYLQEEGLKLINDEKDPTYICHNGKSTIDLVFTRGFAIVDQRQGEEPIRKHLPVMVTLKGETILKRASPSPIGRRIDAAILEEAAKETASINKLIEEGKIDEAAECINSMVKKATIQPKKRKGKS